MAAKNWETYSHPADMGIRGYGPTKESAFANAGLALVSIITEPEKIQPKQVVEIFCGGSQLDLLFVSWINALLYEMSTRDMLFGRFEVVLEENGLRAKAWGEKLDVNRHNPGVEVKAATFSDLKVEREKSGRWVAQCIVDV